MPRFCCRPPLFSFKLEALTSDLIKFSLFSHVLCRRQRAQPIQDLCYDRQKAGGYDTDGDIVITVLLKRHLAVCVCFYFSVFPFYFIFFW